MKQYSFSDSTSIQQAVNEYTELIKQTLSHLHGINSIALNTTGGLDTRTVLAGLLDEHITPQLIYGVGNSELTNTKRSDLRIARELSDQFDLPFYKMDWSGNNPHSNETLSTHFKKFGFKYTTYGCPESLLQEFNGGISPYPQLQIGGYGPAFSNSAPWELPEKDYTIEDLVNLLTPDYFTSDSFNYWDKYHDDLVNDIKIALDQANIHYPESGASLSDLVQAQTFLRVRSASGMINFANEFNYMFCPFIIKKLHDPLVTIPTTYRQQNEFQLRVTENLNKNMFNVSVFSGTNPQKVDMSEYTITDTSSQKYKQTILSAISSLLPAHLLSPAKSIHTYIASDPDDNITIDKLVQDNSSDYVLNDRILEEYILDTSGLGIRELNKLHRVSFGINQIEDKNTGEFR
jgi:hypothetical protein